MCIARLNCRAGQDRRDGGGGGGGGRGGNLLRAINLLGPLIWELA